jgi:ABC-type sulfate/molybdate transport systems ATPase subunit/ABC-type sulfate transport system permease component
MGRTPLPWLGGLLVVYLLAPVAVLVATTAAGRAAPSAPGLAEALLVSVATATLSTGVMLLSGVPLGYLLARGRGPWVQAVGLLVQLPLALPPLVAGILLLLLVGPYTPIGQWTGGALTDSLAGVVLAQTFVASPFVVVAARAAFAALPTSVEGVAATLGLGPWQRFLRVALPGAWAGVRAGLLLGWGRAFGEFGATVMVAYHPYTLPVYTFVQFGSEGLSATRGPAVIALLAALAVLTAAEGLGRRRARAAGRPPVPAPAPVAVARRSWAGETLAFRLVRRLPDFTVDVAVTAQARRLAILGPSGSGKTLTLRMLAGLDQPDDGFVRLGGRDIGELPPEARGIGYVPQDFGLVPHLDVWRQVTLGPRSEPGLAWAWLGRLGLERLVDRPVDALSGGQRQRVALVRALAAAPSLLLLDEPFSALDAPVRAQLRYELAALLEAAGLPVVLVSHDPEDVRALADEVAVLSDGRLLQCGPTSEVFRRPGSLWVARLVGLDNVAEGVVAEEGALVWAGRRVAAKVDLPPGTPVLWHVPAEAVRLDAADGIPAVVESAYGEGEERRTRLRLPDGRRWTAIGPWAVSIGCEVTIGFAPGAVRAWPRTEAGDGRVGTHEL